MLHVPNLEVGIETCDVGRPGGLSNKPPSEVGNLIVGKEDTLFGRPSDPGKDISRDLVRLALPESDPRCSQKTHSQAPNAAFLR